MSRNGACHSNISDEIGLDVYVDAILKQMPVSDEKLEEIRKTTKDDNELQELQKYVQRGWPNTPKDLPAMIRPYWNYRDEITVVDSIVFKSRKIIIPKALQSEMLGRIHTGHMGVQKCKERAHDVLFWPRMCKEIENMVEQCTTCQEYRTLSRKSLFCHTTYQSVHGKWLPLIYLSGIMSTTYLWWIITATILRLHNLQIRKAQW